MVCANCVEYWLIMKKMLQEIGGKYEIWKAAFIIYSLSFAEKAPLLLREENKKEKYMLHSNWVPRRSHEQNVKASRLLPLNVQ